MKAYLEKLIKVLSDEDREKIKAIPLKTSKLKVFLNYLLQIHSGEEMPKGELMKYLRVDDKMLRKMKSVLLLRPPLLNLKVALFQLIPLRPNSSALSVHI